MGVNTAKKGIVSDALVREASKEEIIRRYFFYKKKLHGKEKAQTLKRMREILKKAKISL